MSGSSPPSFDSFFKQQKERRSSTGNSSSNPYGLQGSFQTSHLQQLGDLPLTDEPSTLVRRGSNTSVHSLRHGHARDAHVHGLGSGSSRQDSFPFGESSTLISTAPNGRIHAPPVNGNPHPEAANMYAPPPQHFPSDGQFGYQPQMGEQDNLAQWATTQNNPHTQPSPFSANSTPASGGLKMPGTAASEAYMYDHASPYSNPALSPRPTGTWENEFLAQDTGSIGNDAVNQQEGAWGGDAQGNAGLTHEEQESLSVLEQIISRASSREPSPFPQTDHDNQLQQQQAQAAALNSFAHQHSGSQRTSRSPSPFPMSTVSPPLSAPFQRAPSPGGSPFMSKPHSPPALVIPNQGSPSPSLPPIVTQPQPAQTQMQQQGTNLAGQTSMGGLLPPVNPALEHLSGMAGISPIAPNADGPMIYIQPSTPISGMKDGRGLFDAALRRAGQMAQANQALHGQQGQQQPQQDAQQNFTVPPPAQAGSQARQVGGMAGQGIGSGQPDFAALMQQQAASDWAALVNMQDLQVRMAGRPRAKSDSYTSGGNEGLDKQALLQYLAAAQGMGGGVTNVTEMPLMQGGDWRTSIDAWRSTLMGDNGPQQGPAPTVDPRNLPGNDAEQNFIRSFQHQHQFTQLQAQRAKMAPLNVNTATTTQSGVFKYEPGEFSPTSLAFYQQMGFNPADASQLAGTSSAPFFSTTFENIPQAMYPQTAGPAQQSFLAPDLAGMGGRRRSIAEGQNHPAAGLGTPGYGMGLQAQSPFGTLGPGKVRGVSPGSHRRAAKSEDFGRGGTGWGVGTGGSTSDFLNSITANDGTLLPPSRGRSGSHSRHSSGSSVRSASPALSISSQGSSYFEGGGRMDMPEGAKISQYGEEVAATGPTAGGKSKLAKMKVTSMATEVASTSRRTNDGVFKCPIPGCGSTFTRHFNLKGHLRSHNDERPYKCLFDGCPKSVVGFARQHDCKRHMLLHEGLRPFECDGCGKKFARLDALTRHHKSEQGQECALSHPLPTNPDGSPMSESQYKAYRAAQDKLRATRGGGGGGGMRRLSSYSAYSGDERSGEEDLGTGSGMEDYDRF